MWRFSISKFLYHLITKYFIILVAFLFKSTFLFTFDFFFLSCFTECDLEWHFLTCTSWSWLYNLSISDGSGLTYLSLWVESIIAFITQWFICNIHISIFDQCYSNVCMAYTLTTCWWLCLCPKVFDIDDWYWRLIFMIDIYDSCKYMYVHTCEIVDGFWKIKSIGIDDFDVWYGW